MPHLLDRAVYQTEHIRGSVIDEVQRIPNKHRTLGKPQARSNGLDFAWFAGTQVADDEEHYQRACRVTGK
jgi:hypothetical protein